MWSVFRQFVFYLKLMVLRYVCFTSVLLQVYLHLGLVCVSNDFKSDEGLYY